MHNLAHTFPDGGKYTPGICIWCHEPFDEESSDGFYYGHKTCAEKFEADSDRRALEDLIASCPIGTRFDLAGGASCEWLAIQNPSKDWGVLFLFLY